MITFDFRGKTTAILLSALLAAVPAGATAQRTAAPSKLDTVAVLASARADIEAANAAWIPGLRTRNADTIVAAYADSGLFIGPDGVVTRGRGSIRSLYTSRFPRMREIRDGGVVQDGLVAVAPDLIYEWGHAWIEMASATPGGSPVRGGGAYLTVWRRESDGHWRIVRNLSF